MFVTDRHQERHRAEVISSAALLTPITNDPSSWCDYMYSTCSRATLQVCMYTVIPQIDLAPVTVREQLIGTFMTPGTVLYASNARPRILGASLTR